MPFAVAYLEKQKYCFLNGNTLANARVKYVATADPGCSSAQPLDVGTDLGLCE